MVKTLTLARNTTRQFAYMVTSRVSRGMLMDLPYAIAYFACWLATWIFPAMLMVGAERAGPFTLVWVLAALECVVREVTMSTGHLSAGFERNTYISLVAIPLLTGAVFGHLDDGLLLAPLLFVVLHIVAMAGRDRLEIIYRTLA